MAAAVLTVGGMVLTILTAVALFGEEVEDGPLQVAMTLGLALATVIAMFGGYTAEDLSAAMSRSINSALSTIFVLIAIGALIGSLFLSGTIATVIYYGAEYGSPKILYILVFVLATVLSYAIGSSFTTIAAVGLPFVALAPAMDVSPAIVAAAAVCGAFTGDGLGRISDTFILTSPWSGRSQVPTSTPSRPCWRRAGWPAPCCSSSSASATEATTAFLSLMAGTVSALLARA